MSLSVNYSILRKLNKEDKKKITELGLALRMGNLTSREMIEGGAPLIYNPVSIEENRCGPSTEISVGNCSDTDLYVPATPENMNIIKKIQDIVLKEE